jgi:hypothetical protein
MLLPHKRCFATLAENSMLFWEPSSAETVTFSPLPRLFVRPTENSNDPAHLSRLILYSRLCLAWGTFASKLSVAMSCSLVGGHASKAGNVMGFAFSAADICPCVQHHAPFLCAIDKHTACILPSL